MASPRGSAAFALCALALALSAQTTTETAMLSPLTAEKATRPSSSPKAHVSMVAKFIRHLIRAHANVRSHAVAVDGREGNKTVRGGPCAYSNEDFKKVVDAKKIKCKRTCCAVMDPLFKDDLYVMKYTAHKDVVWWQDKSEPNCMCFKCVTSLGARIARAELCFGPWSLRPELCCGCAVARLSLGRYGSGQACPMLHCAPECSPAARSGPEPPLAPGVGR